MTFRLAIMGVEVRARSLDPSNEPTLRHVCGLAVCSPPLLEAGPQRRDDEGHDCGRGEDGPGDCPDHVYVHSHQLQLLLYQGENLIPANLAVDRALDGWTSWRVFGSPDQLTSEHRRGSADALCAQRLLLRLVRGDETTNGAVAATLTPTRPPTRQRPYATLSRSGTPVDDHRLRGERVWCRALGHLMRRADTRVGDQRGDVVVVVERLGAENPVMSCDVHILVHEAAEPVAS
jgi:hypothetical protein